MDRVSNQAPLEHLHHLRVVVSSGNGSVRDPVSGIQNGLELLDWVLDFAERHFSVDEVVEDASETPDVALVADLDGDLAVAPVVRVLDGFRRHEVEGADQVVLGHVSLVVAHGGSDPEVDQLQEAAGDQKVGRLQVRMNDAFAMNDLEWQKNRLNLRTICEDHFRFERNDKTGFFGGVF